MESLRRAVLRHPALARLLRPTYRRVRSLQQSHAEAADRIPSSWADYARDRRHASGTILIIDDKVPEFDKHAGGNAVFHYLRLLVEHDFKVVYLPDNRHPAQPYTGILQRMGVEVLYGHVDVDGWLAAHGAELDWVVLARPNIAPKYLDVVRRRTRAHLVYYTVDLHYLRELRRHEMLGDSDALQESRRVQGIEEDIFRSVDSILTPSSHEVPLIRALTARPVRSIPLFCIQGSHPGARLGADERSDVIFVGGFAHPPNIDAARFLVQEVMPTVWAAFPATRVVIIGTRPTPEVVGLQGPNVSIIGYVPDLEPYFARARASVNPIRYGAGVKGKILSSLEAGVPVVTTTIGNEGIGLVGGRHALLADTADGIAAHVISLVDDPELVEALSAAGRRFVLERYGEEITRDALLAGLGVTLCAVCGRRSMVAPGSDGAAGTVRVPCAGCGADATATLLAEVVTRPYRKYGGVSLREAIPHLRGTRIRGIAVDGPVARSLSGCRSFDATTGTDRRVDLVVAGGSWRSVGEVETMVEQTCLTLRIGGRLAFVVDRGDLDREADDVVEAVASTLLREGFEPASYARLDGSTPSRLVAFDAVRLH